MTTPATRAKCLIVVADAALLADLEAQLRAPDREICTATSAAEAATLARQHDFAFVLLDATLPALDGQTLTQLARGAQGSDITPIVFMKAGGPDDPLPEFPGFEAAAVDVLSKPVNAAILRRKASLFVELYRQKQALSCALQAREKVLATVSHDMRTPLAVVHTTTTMLLNPKYQLSPQQVREQHERIRRNVDLMNRMIGDLQDLASLRAGLLSISPKPVVIDELLREVVTVHESAAREKGITLTYEAGSEVMRTEADRARLTQLFQTLIGNAMKSCKTGDRIAVTSSSRGNEARIEISDTGPGIAPEDLPHVFDPYYSASQKHPKSGAGLGLYIGKGIVEAHGGRIGCASEPDAGTSFSIVLPLIATAVPTPS